MSWTGEFLTLALIALVMICTLFRRRRPCHYPPGPLGLPLVGNLHQLGAQPYRAFMKMKEKYGDIIAIDFGGFRGVVLNDYKVIREAFSLSEFTGRPHLQPFINRCGGDRLRGVGFNDGIPWTEQRRFALKTLRDFGFGKKSMEALIHVEISELISTLSRFIGKPFVTRSFFNLAVVNSLWSILTGERFSHDDQRLLQIVQLTTDGVSNSPTAGAFFFFPWLCKIIPNLSGYSSYVKFQLKIIDMMKEKFAEHKSTFQNGQDFRDFLDVQIQRVLDTTNSSSTFFGEEGERNAVITLSDLFIGGIESTSSTLSWTFLYLSLNPLSQQKLFDEIQAVVGLSRLPSLNDKAKMPYAEAVILEVLRISSLAPLAIFHRTSKDVELHSYLIPKDTLIVPNLYGANHDPNVWGDPDTFRPERFILEDGTVDRHHAALMPFGSGKRICLGETLAKDQLFLFVTSLFQTFFVEPNPAKPKPSTEPNPGIALIPQPCEFILHERCSSL